MILSNVSVPLLGMVDTGVTGHLDSPAYLGAVAIGRAHVSMRSAYSAARCPAWRPMPPPSRTGSSA